MAEHVSIDAIREHVRLYIDRRGIQKKALAVAICGLYDTTEQAKFLAFLHGTLPVVSLNPANTSLSSSSTLLSTTPTIPQVPPSLTFQSKRLAKLAAAATTTLSLSSLSSDTDALSVVTPLTNHHKYSIACSLWLKEHGQRPGFLNDCWGNRNSIRLPSLRSLQIINQQMDILYQLQSEIKHIPMGYYPILEATSLSSTITSELSTTTSTTTTSTESSVSIGDISTLDGTVFVTKPYTQDNFSTSNSVTTGIKRKRPTFLYTPNPVLKRPNVTFTSGMKQNHDSVIITTILERIVDSISRISSSLFENEYRPSFSSIAPKNSLTLNNPATSEYRPSFSSIAPKNSLTLNNPATSEQFSQNKQPRSFPSLSFYTTVSMDPLAKTPSTSTHTNETNLFYVPLYIQLYHKNTEENNNSTESFLLLKETFVWDLYESQITPLEMAQSLVESIKYPEIILSLCQTDNQRSKIRNKLTILIANTIITQIYAWTTRLAPSMDKFLHGFVNEWKCMYSSLLSPDSATTDHRSNSYWYIPVDLLNLLGSSSKNNGTVLFANSSASVVTESTIDVPTATSITTPFEIFRNSNSSSTSGNTISLPLFQMLSKTDLEYFDNAESKNLWFRAPVPTPSSLSSSTAATTSTATKESLPYHPSQTMYYPSSVTPPWYPIISPLALLQASLSTRIMDTTPFTKDLTLGTNFSFMQQLFQQAMVTSPETQSTTLLYSSHSGTETLYPLSFIPSSSASHPFQNLYLPVQFTVDPYSVNYRVRIHVPEYIRLCEQGSTELIIPYLLENIRVSINAVSKTSLSLLPEAIIDTSVFLVQHQIGRYIEALISWNLDIILDYTDSKHSNGYIRRHEETMSTRKGTRSTSAGSGSNVQLEPLFKLFVDTMLTTIDLHTIMDDKK